MKINLRFFAGGLFHFSADSDLPVQFDPIKCHRRVRIRGELLSFLAFVICKEHEAVLVETFQQNDAHCRLGVGAGGGEAHRVHIANTGLDGGGKPVRKLFDWIGIKITPAQALPDMLIAGRSRISWHLHHAKNNGC